MPSIPTPSRWFVYLLRCRDGSLYCGITRDIPRRVAQHNAGTGAKYVVPSRRPVACVWKRRAVDQSQALSLEYWVKQQTVVIKESLIEKRTAIRADKDGAWKRVGRASPRNGLR
jgi:putative endonuclease